MRLTVLCLTILVPVEVLEDQPQLLLMFSAVLHEFSEVQQSVFIRVTHLYHRLHTQ